MLNILFYGGLLFTGSIGLYLTSSGLFDYMTFTQLHKKLIDNNQKTTICNKLSNYVAKYKIHSFIQPVNYSNIQYYSHLKQEWFKAFKVTLLNIFILGLLTPFATMLLIHRGIYGFNCFDDFVSFNFKSIVNWLAESSLISFLYESFLIFFYTLITEIVFYVTHRLLHTSYFYPKVHKLHHYFINPFAISGFYAHPIEFIFGNLLSIIFGPLLIPGHILTVFIYFCIAVTSVSISHSGYSFNSLISADHHDIHHKIPNKNYGVLGICDLILNTEYIYDHNTAMKDVDKKNY